MSKGFKISLIVYISLFVLLGGFVTFWYFGDTYPDFYSIAEKEFKVEGLSEGLVPQGICYDEVGENFFVSGYMDNGDPTRIYIIDENGENDTVYFTLEESGKTYTGHGSGVATDGVNLFVASEDKVRRIALSSLAGIASGDVVQVADSFEVANAASSITANDGYLWVGEFHNGSSYKTPASHEVVINEKETNNAIALCFELDSSAPFGVTSTDPISALSMPDKVQGMIVTNDKILLSTSYSIVNSEIFEYENITSFVTAKTFDANGVIVPLHILQDDILLDTKSIPAMSEEIVLVDSKVYVLFESASNKYGMFNRESLANVWSYALA